MKKTVIPFVLLLLSACASKPVIDLRGVDQAKYDADLKECEGYRVAAEERATSNALAGMGDYVQRGGMVKKCMAGRGYKVLN